MSFYAIQEPSQARPQYRGPGVRTYSRPGACVGGACARVPVKVKNGNQYVRTTEA